MMKYVLYGAIVVIGLLLTRLALTVGIALAPMIGLVILVVVGLYAIGWCAEKVWVFMKKHRFKKEEDVIITPPPKEK
jgi:hypothetical protein